MRRSVRTDGYGWRARHKIPRAWRKRSLRKSQPKSSDDLKRIWSIGMVEMVGTEESVRKSGRCHCCCHCRYSGAVM